MLLLVLALAQAPIELTPGLVITHSVRVKSRTYRLSGPPITIRGDSITVDFAGATLQGSDPEVDPDQRRETAIVIDGGHNIQILNARIQGYRFGILARGTERLTVRASDLSHSWKPRLFSLLEHESLVDWLSFHHNENNEWLRFGAAIYLQDVKGADVRNNSAMDGMNGLMLVRSTGVVVRDNNFSFNSGLGIGLYRSSEDTIVHNRLDYNVRGYSHGRYSRGQYNTISCNLFDHDSTAIRLWADSIEPSEWGYPKHHDTRSHSYWITGNALVGNRVGLKVRNTQGVVFQGNRAKAVDSLLQWEPIPDFQVGAVTEDTLPEQVRDAVPDSIPVSDLSRRDRSAIGVDEGVP